MGEAKRAWRGFWHWWLSELGACLPAWLKGWLGVGARGGWLLREDGAWQLYRDPRPDADPVGSLDPETGEGEGAALRLARTGVYLGLDPRHVLIREVELPLAAEENLRDVLGFEMDRHTPFHRDQAWFDYRLLSRNAEQGRLRVRLIVTPRQAVEKALDGLRSIGVPIRGLLPVEAARTGLHDINLLPADRCDRRSRIPGLLNLALFLVLLGLGATAVQIPIERQQAILDQLQPQLREARAAAEETRQLRQALEQAGEAARFMPRRLQARTDLLQVLEELTRLLPDDTWLRQVELDGPDLRLFGESGDAAALVPLLESSPMLAEVGFRSPVTKDPRSGSERFQLAMRLVPGEGVDR